MGMVITKQFRGHGTICKTVDDATNAQPTDPVSIKGFASTLDEDRDGDTIDPALFDVKTFMANPQLWYDHQKWMRDDGNEVSVGLVEDATPAKAEKGAGNTINIVALATGKTIDTLEDDDRHIVKVGEIGLWVTCKVLEPPVAQLVREKRLNSFSWGGQMVFESSTGPLKRVDLMEVSLVYLPANAKARFVVAKSFTKFPSALVQLASGDWGEIAGHLDDSNSGTAKFQSKRHGIITMDGLTGKCSFFDTTLEDRAKAEEMAHAMFQANKQVGSALLIVPSGRETNDGGGIYTVVQGITRTIAPDVTKEIVEPPAVPNLTEDEKALLALSKSSADPSKGGEDKMELTPELKEMFKGITDAVTGLVSKVDVIATRVEAVEAAKAAAVPAPAPAPDPAPAPAPVVKAADAASADSEILTVLTGLTDLVKGLDTKVSAVDARMTAIEGTSQKSAQPSDDADADEVDEVAIQREISKGFKNLSKEDRAAVVDRALNDVLLSGCPSNR